MKLQIFYIRPKDTYQINGDIEWADYHRKKWYPLWHGYVGRKDEIPEAGNTLKTKVDSDIKRRLLDRWDYGQTVKVRGYYDSDSSRLIVVEILK